MQQHGHVYFACSPPPPPPLTLRVCQRQNWTFSEQKVNWTFHNNRQNWTFSQQKAKLDFLQQAMLPIKLKGTTNAARWWQLFCLLPPTDPGKAYFKRSKFNFFRSWACCISNLRKSQMHQHDSKNIIHRPTPMVMLHIKLKGMEHRSHTLNL